MLSTKTKRLLAVAAFSLAFLGTRLPYLGYDEINPDAVNWHFRSEQFIVGLKSGDLAKTYQHYHPGVTLMWVMGVPIEIARQINPAVRVYNQDNFLQLHRLAKYALVLVQLALSVILIVGLKESIGLNKSLLGVAIFSFEPWFLGNSRLLHMDVLLALFTILSLVFGFNCLTRPAVKTAVISGIFAGLAFLTKSVGLLTLGFILGSFILWALRTHSRGKRVVAYPGAFILSVVITIFTLFPALWLKPVTVLSSIYNEGLRIGTRRGHEQVIMGDTTDIAGPGFYPLVLALKTSPVLWLGVGLLMFQLIHKRRSYQGVDKQLLLYLTVFYLIYFLGMSLASKKIDRYMLPLFPLLGLASAVSILESMKEVKIRCCRITVYVLLLLVVGVGVLCPLVKLYPYWFAYTNPLFGTGERANKIVGQKPFGIGIPEVKDLLVQKYGNNAALGFIDIKPMSMIYPNSKLFDIREAGTRRYDLIILGPNEDLPNNVLEGQYQFKLDLTKIINGLAYWRVYKKV